MNQISFHEQPKVESRPFTNLPQTQDELDQLSIDSSDYQIKEYIQDLFVKHHCTKKQVTLKVLKFFSAYDASRDLNILVLKKHLNNRKKDNKRFRTY